MADVECECLREIDAEVDSAASGEVPLEEGSSISAEAGLPEIDLDLELQSLKQIFPKLIPLDHLLSYYFC